MTTAKDKPWRRPVGYIVRSPCGREWWLPFAAIRQDYINFLIQEDGKTQQQAAEQIDQEPKFIETWFHEQYIWDEVDRDGTMLTPVPHPKYRGALDCYRADSGTNVSEDITPRYSIPIAMKRIQARSRK